MKLVPTLIGVAVVGFAAAYFGTPVLAARDLTEAAKTGDEAALKRLVDFPAFRTSLKDELREVHSDAAGRTLGLELAQLDRSVDGPDGAPIDQLAHFTELGILDPPPPVTPLPALTSDAPVTDRARAYLHSNCSQCHRPDAPSGRANIDLRFDIPFAEVGICDKGPRAGDLGLADARLLVPGDPARSILSARMHTLGSTRMPGLASAIVDDSGVALIDEWISSLASCP